jgi:hypothetical protein
MQALRLTALVAAVPDMQALPNRPLQAGKFRHDTAIDPGTAWDTDSVTVLEAFTDRPKLSSKRSLAPPQCRIQDLGHLDLTCPKTRIPVMGTTLGGH